MRFETPAFRWTSSPGQAGLRRLRFARSRASDSIKLGSRLRANDALPVARHRQQTEGCVRQLQTAFAPEASARRVEMRGYASASCRSLTGLIQAATQAASVPEAEKDSRGRKGSAFGVNGYSAAVAHESEA
jgi:hypothetical protein